MPLNINLPTTKSDGDAGHSAGHNATNTAVNSAGAAVDAHTAATTSVHGIADTSALVTSATTTALAGRVTTLESGGATLVSRFKSLEKRFRFKDASSILTNSQFTKADTTTFTKVYGPSVIRAAGKLTSPLNTYYLYTSTDHDANTGGIGLATAASPTGPWTPYNSGAAIFTDTTTGTGGTETPDIQWDPDAGVFILYYQEAGVAGFQVTAAAVSTDGVTGWEMIGQVLPTSTTQAGHTGYFRATRYGKHNLVGVSLLWPGNTPMFALWRSADGYVWQQDWRVLARQLDSSLSQTRKIDGPYAYFEFDGELWAATGEVIANSGGSATDMTIRGGPVTADLRSYKRPPDILWQPSLGETTDLLGWSIFVDSDGTPYLYLSVGSNIYVAPGEVY